MLAGARGADIERAPELFEHVRRCVPLISRANRLFVKCHPPRPLREKRGVITKEWWCPRIFGVQADAETSSFCSSITSRRNFSQRSTLPM